MQNMFKFKQIIIAFMLVGATGIVMAQTLQIKTSKPWQKNTKNGKNIYTLTHSGKGWPRLFFSPTIKPDSYYKVTWVMKSSVNEKGTKFGLKIQLNDKKAYHNYVLAKDWNNYTGYFYSGKADAVNISLFSKPGVLKTILVKDIKVAQLTAKKFLQNLLPDGDFESSQGMPVNWRCREDCISLSGAQGFLSGEKSMEVNFPARDTIKQFPRIQCLFMPVIPGKEFELIFWAKAESNFVIALSLYKVHKFHKGFNFLISTEWKQYSLKVKIPVKLRDLLISIRGKISNKAGKVWFDDMVFRERVEK